MVKQIFFDIEGRNKMKKGVDTLANAVKITLGPKGRNVVIQKQFGPPVVTKDGVTVAKEMELSDPVENMGAQMVKEVSKRTADIAGDGTTTATVLAQSIITEGLKMVAAGANPMDLKRGIDKAVATVVTALKERSTPVGADNTLIESIATVSANNDTEIGKLIAQAFAKVGKEGVITVEEAKGTETTVEVVEGMQFDRGYISPYFVTNNKMETEFTNPLILICEKKVSVMKDIIPLLESTMKSGRSMLIICEDLEGEALATLVVNKIKAGLKIAAVKAPGFGDRRKDVLQDLCTLTGATLISEEQGLKLEDATADHLGGAASITITRNITTLIGGKGKKEDVAARVSQIKAQLETSTSDYDKERLQERIAKLSGGIAVIYVGAGSEVEMKEKNFRVDDALHATRAAVEEGIVPGGGVAYIRAIESLEKLKGSTEDENVGIQIIRRALEEPLRCIVVNAGLDGGVIANEVKKGKDDYGFNARTEQYENLLKTGVIDPTKVSRIALENAASIAGMILTTDCVIADKPEKKQPARQNERDEFED